MIDKKINREIFTIVDLQDNSDDLDYWLNQSAQERIQAIEMMRKINYGEDAVTARLQRFFEVAELV